VASADLGDLDPAAQRKLGDLLEARDVPHQRWGVTLRHPAATPAVVCDLVGSVAQSAAATGEDGDRNGGSAPSTRERRRHGAGLGRTPAPPPATGRRNRCS
jgi:hypothetical protein